MTDQTNAEVSDERLREIEGWAKLVSTFPQAEGHPPPERYADIAAVCTELLNRRSVTSQASEGADDEALTLAKDEGADFVLTELGRALNCEWWTQHDGSETWDGDVHATLMHLLWDAGVLDRETNARLSPPISDAELFGQLTGALRTAVSIIGHPDDAVTKALVEIVARAEAAIIASPSKRVERLEALVEELKREIGSWEMQGADEQPTIVADFIDKFLGGRS